MGGAAASPPPLGLGGVELVARTMKGRERSKIRRLSVRNRVINRGGKGGGARETGELIGIVRAEDVGGREREKNVP